jgi:hypothetical protein
MKKIECYRESEVLEVVTCGRWPEQCPEELRVHVESCMVCADVLEVAIALHVDRNSSHPSAHVPSADLVWWRAELRARQEAMRTAARPITLVETFGAAAAIGAAVALLKIAWPWLREFLIVPDFALLSPAHLGLLIALGLAVLIIAPLAMYLVLSDE